MKMFHFSDLLIYKNIYQHQRIKIIPAASDEY